MLRVEVLSEELVECSVNSESYIGTITEASRLAQWQLSKPIALSHYMYAASVLRGHTGS